MQKSCFFQNRFHIYGWNNDLYTKRKNGSNDNADSKKDITPVIIIFIGSFICFVLMFEIRREIKLYMEVISETSCAWWGSYKYWWCRQQHKINFYNIYNEIFIIIFQKLSTTLSRDLTFFTYWFSRKKEFCSICIKVSKLRAMF